jgi:acyl carrier protein
MTQEEVLAQITVIFKDVLDDDSIVLKRETTAEDIEDWDSLTHIQLIVTIEKKFGFKFTTAEINSFKNVGEMVDSVLKRKS